MAAGLLAVAVKACTFRFPAGTCIAAAYADFLGAALAVLVEITVSCLAPYADLLAGAAYDSVHHAACPFPEALTAGFVWLCGVAAADGDVAFGTEVVIVVHAVVC